MKGANDSNYTGGQLQTVCGKDLFYLIHGSKYPNATESFCLQRLKISSFK